MRPIFRYLIKLNRKYDQVHEPWRLLILIGPLMLAGVAYSVFELIFNISVWGQLLTPVTLMLLGAFSLPYFFIDKKWVNTYIIGWPYI